MRNLTYLICLLSCLYLAACGGGSSSSNATQTSPSPRAQNVQAIVVDSGPGTSSGQPVGAVNSPYVTLTVCQPGSSTQCQTIDHVLVDTGSSGLRIVASSLSGGFALPALSDTNGNPLGECLRFADGYSWGPVKQADLRIAGEMAPGISIQVIGDSTFPTVPSTCPGGLVAENTVAAFRANGLLGISPSIQDCGDSCATQAFEGWYYACSSVTCTAAAVSISKQVGNPVAAFAQDNNGTVMQLPAVGANGAINVTGSLIFGIGTQTNNALGNANIHTLNSTGDVSVLYQGQVMPAFFDSGSNGIFFSDSNIQNCSISTGFYCPSSTLSRSAVNTGQNGHSSTVNFSVANADALFQSNPNHTAFSNLAGGAIFTTFFDWGMPFYFGRSVYTALEGRMAGGTMGPYVAY